MHLVVQFFVPDSLSKFEFFFQLLDRGSLGISNENFGKVDVQVACMSSKHCPEVLKSVCDFPALLPTEVLPRLDVWPKCFSTSPPTDDIIDLYIFSENERCYLL